MKHLDRALTTVENVLAASALGLAALISILNIIIRQFGQAWFWTEEAVIYLIIFSTFIGAVITLRHNEHVSVDILGVFFRERGKKWLSLVGGIVTLVYLGVMAVLGWMLLMEPFSRTTVTPVLKLQLWVVELAVPLGMTLMFVRALEMLWRIWKYGTLVSDPDEVLEAEAEATGLSVEEVRASHEAITTGKGASLQEVLILDEESHLHHPVDHHKYEDPNRRDDKETER
ncbi:TRAP transporter small permease [Intrasporangium calvum]|uniref:TRAP transporter small permease n=1 Tax=Intrasporangium calvum TaxID=53358 RepID=A0ABT5GL15_9MICO|nr:TRAP transporter small permease [Intrasporangium calvum]MDC5698748.1 TRAP transporter small permease [Intrasporangium calvum]